MNTPSVKKLAAIFSDPKQAKRILLMTENELEQLPCNKAWINQCWHTPKTEELRMNALNDLSEFYGVESFETAQGEAVTYLNSGDTYTLTLVRFRGRYIVTTWGDIAEKHGAK